MNKVTVNGKKMFEVDGNNVNGDIVLTDIVQTGERFFHVLHNGRSYQVEVLNINRHSKLVSLKVNHSIYEMSVRDRFDQILDQMGLSGNIKHKIRELRAPMPGLVIDVRVEAGKQVKTGDPVIVLEAMKMENVLKASGDGTVKSVEVGKGKNVEKNQVLIVFE